MDPIFVKITVPDGEYCDEKKLCTRLNNFKDWKCLLFRKYPKVRDEGLHTKLPECLAAPKAMGCGHHPDAKYEIRNGTGTLLHETCWVCKRK